MGYIANLFFTNSKPNYKLPKNVVHYFIVDILYMYSYFEADVSNKLESGHRRLKGLECSQTTFSFYNEFNKLIVTGDSIVVMYERSIVKRLSRSQTVMRLKFSVIPCLSLSAIASAQPNTSSSPQPHLFNGNLDTGSHASSYSGRHCLETDGSTYVPVKHGVAVHHWPTPSLCDCGVKGNKPQWTHSRKSGMLQHCVTCSIWTLCGNNIHVQSQAEGQSGLGLRTVISTSLPGPHYIQYYNRWMQELGMLMGLQRPPIMAIKYAKFWIIVNSDQLYCPFKCIQKHECWGPFTMVSLVRLLCTPNCDWLPSSLEEYLFIDDDWIHW